MPAGKSGDNRGVMAALIVFVVLFLIAATAAVILYTKYEDQKTIAQQNKDAKNEVVSNSEYNQLSKTVGKRLDGQTYTGTMLTYIDQLCQYITGDIAEASAAAKIEKIKAQINDLNVELGDDTTAVFGAEGVDLHHIISDLKTKLELQRETADKLRKSIDDLQEDYDTIIAESAQKEKSLTDMMDHYQQQADEIQKSYDLLKADMEKSTEDQVLVYIDRLDSTKKTLQDTSTELEATKQALSETSQQLTLALTQLQAIKPQPDQEVAAFDMDAKVTSIDETGMIYLNVGSDDHAYVGLTFVVFDKNNPRPKDGVGKAEVEIFRVMSKVAAARIIKQYPRSPIAQNDVVVNLIWDKDSSNKFVVIGDFDFNNDGKVDLDGKQKVVELIERWGGTVSDDVTINTDFVVMGTPPELPMEPTREQIEYDPTVEQKYLKKVAASQKYMNTIERADRLSVPKFNRERFFNLIGYSATAERETPF